MCKVNSGCRHHGENDFSLGMGLPGMGLLKFLHKVSHLSIPSFISKYHIERCLYILFLSASSLHCPTL